MRVPFARFQAPVPVVTMASNRLCIEVEHGRVAPGWLDAEEGGPKLEEVATSDDSRIECVSGESSPDWHRLE